VKRVLFLAILVSCNDWDSLSTSFGTPQVCTAFVVAGDTHTCARKADGTMLCWGDNRFGQLGTGDNQRRSTPTPVAFNGLGVSKVFLPAGDGDITSDRAVFTCAITTDNALSCWGDNRFGQLGTGDKAQTSVPTRVTALDANISRAANGAGHTCAQTTDGKLLCWGRNDSGQLGTGDLTQHLSPTPITLPIAIERLSAGGTSTCARGTDSTLLCFGANEHGQLGLGTTTQQPKPTSVAPLAGKVVRVSAGAAHACAFTTEGNLYCWGDNRDGQLGTGDTNARNVPTKIDPKGAVTDVFAGGSHTCAIKSDGSLSCWGANRFGQLGTGDTDPRAIPSTVASDVLGNQVAAAYAGGAHTCVVKVDGSVWCWGNNQYGQLGVDGPGATSPVRVMPPCQ
jgi:alpha-tubulin suppressor-like RCC1 family protein